MENKEQLLKKHKLGEGKEYLEQYKENPPQIIEKLPWYPGEGIISELDKKDLIQLGSRYLNDMSVFLKNILHEQLRIEALLTFLLEEKGIDVSKKFKEDAIKKERELEARIQKSKENLIKASKK